MFYHSHMYVCITKTEIFDKNVSSMDISLVPPLILISFRKFCLLIVRNAVVESVFVRGINTFFF